jgi:prepilin-type N-terminal cleavage/methylation domain-containing protein
MVFSLRYGCESIIKKEAPGMNLQRKGFTLIELLIVVAIIAILAAIAIPNFLEAHVRSKVARVKTDARSVATAVEAYNADHTSYPPSPVILQQLRGNRYSAYSFIPDMVTTPIAYISSKNIKDVFAQHIFDDEYDRIFWQNCKWLHLHYAAGGWQEPYFSTLYYPAYGEWKIGSLGPNADYDGGLNVYDPTNGTVSSGDIYRTQKRVEGYVD